MSESGAESPLPNETGGQRKGTPWEAGRGIGPGDRDRVPCVQGCQLPPCVQGCQHPHVSRDASPSCSSHRVTFSLKADCLRLLKASRPEDVAAGTL